MAPDDRQSRGLAGRECQGWGPQEPGEATSPLSGTSSPREVGTMSSGPLALCLHEPGGDAGETLRDNPTNHLPNSFMGSNVYVQFLL